MGMRKSSDALMLLILLVQCSCCWLLLTTLLHQEHMEPLIMVHEIEHHVQLMSAMHASEMHSSQVHAELKQTKKRVQPFELHLMMDAFGTHQTTKKEQLKQLLLYVSISSKMLTFILQTSLTCAACE